MNRRNLLKSLTLSAFTPVDLFDNVSESSMGLSDLSETPFDAQHRLWYTYPAKYWNSQSMHIGNGFLGLSFLGGVETEIICVTEKSMWTGGPGEFGEYDGGIKQGGKDHLKVIRELIKENTHESLRQADELCRNHFTGDARGYGHFSSFGRLNLNFAYKANSIKNYQRLLDLRQAIANVQYDIGEATFSREYFCSYPDRVAVMKYSANQRSSLSFTIQWDCFQKNHVITFQNNVLHLSGKINSNDRSFVVKIHISVTDGHVFFEDNILHIENSTSVVLLMVGGTEYQPVPPLYNGNDVDTLTDGQLRSALTFSYALLRQRHIKDYKELYDRVTLTVPVTKRWNKTSTDVRWKNYLIKPGDDPGLKVLYFNLSRYLLISCSRPGSLPANLQGGWNMFESAQWSGNYQSNVNLQLNYSSACAVNLNECMIPYLEWIKGLTCAGKRVASEYYGSDGWVSHSIGNIWGFASPGFEIEWGMYPAGAAWHCHYIWEYYIYTEDLFFLKDTGYPIMREAAEFWLQNLLVYNGGLISGPSVSAEHGARIVDGKHIANGSSYGAMVSNLPGNFQDIEMIYELFLNTIKAAETLGTDSEFVVRLRKTKDRLYPIQVGKYGQLQEWIEDIDSPDCNHRHMGHMYAVWPSKQISKDTKILADAAKVALNMRGDERNNTNIPGKDIYTAGNWSLAIRMICWIRLGDAQRANALFTKIITQAGFENLMTFQQITETEKTVKESSDLYYFKTGEVYWYPVWQVDTSLAIAGFVSEMLLQINEVGELFLLPALPDEWPNGNVKGLRAPGNLNVDLEWKDGRTVHYRVQAPLPQKLIVHVNGVRCEIVTGQ